MTRIDAHVGAKIKARRASLEMSPPALARSLSITVADLGLYERGERRVCVSLLFEIANVLDVEIAYFFHDMRYTSELRFTPCHDRGLYLVH